MSKHDLKPSDVRCPPSSLCSRSDYTISTPVGPHSNEIFRTPHAPLATWSLSVVLFNAPLRSTDLRRRRSAEQQRSMMRGFDDDDDDDDD